MPALAGNETGTQIVFDAYARPSWGTGETAGEAGRWSGWRQGMLGALDANPAGGSRFLGTVVHKLTADALEDLYPERFEYYRVGPDFLDTATGELIELTTPAQVAAHQIKPGYEGVSYALYDLPRSP